MESDGSVDFRAKIGFEGSREDGESRWGEGRRRVELTENEGELVPSRRPSSPFLRLSKATMSQLDPNSTKIRIPHTLSPGCEIVGILQRTSDTKEASSSSRKLALVRVISLRPQLVLDSKSTLTLLKLISDPSRRSRVSLVLELATQSVLERSSPLLPSSLFVQVTRIICTRSY